MRNKLLKKKKIHFLTILMFFFLTGFTIFFMVFFFKNPPDNSINFAGELIPNFEQNNDIKIKFKQHYNNNLYNLYYFKKYIKNYNNYIPYIEKTLENNGIPNDFKYLAIIESGLNINSVSNKNAAGIWQFMPETAKDFGLIVNEHIDERFNFEKSTQSAIKYINFLYNIFEDWTLVAASYNRGQNAIKNVLKEQNQDSFYFLELNTETSNYIYKILTLKYFHQKIYTSNKILPYFVDKIYPSQKYTKKNISHIDDIKNWCIEENIDLEEFKKLNLWILGNILPKGDWIVKIPK